MKHLTYGEKAMFLGDAAAQTLLEYASRLADSSRSDTVDVNVIGPDGHSVVATFLLDQGASLMAETADDSAFKEPDNTAAVEYMEQAMSAMEPSSISGLSDEDLKSLEDAFDAGEDSSRG